MTAGVALSQLVPGDRVIDLVAAGTVEDVTPMQRSDGRKTDALKVTFTDGTSLYGPSTWTVITDRQAIDA